MLKFLRVKATSKNAREGRSVRSRVSSEAESRCEQILAKRNPVSDGIGIIFASEFSQQKKAQSNRERVANAFGIAKIGKGIEVIEKRVNVEKEGLKKLIEREAVSDMLHKDLSVVRI